MGSLRGDLSVLGISNLLQALAFSRAEGLLTLELGTQPRVFFLGTTGVRLVRGSRRCQRLEKFLRGRQGTADRTSLARVVREWLLDEMSDLFTWTRGSFRFQESSEVQARQQLLQSAAASFEPEGDLTTLLLEAARRADEMPRLRSVIFDLDAVPERTESGLIHSELCLDAPLLEDLLPRVDGTRTAGAILMESIFPRFPVLLALSRLAQQGALRLRAPAAATSAA